ALDLVLFCSRVLCHAYPYGLQQLLRAYDLGQSLQYCRRFGGQYPVHLEPETAQYCGIVSTVGIHWHWLIAALTVEHIKTSQRAAGARVKNPVLLDASRLILIELVGPVLCHTVVRNHFYH